MIICIGESVIDYIGNDRFVGGSILNTAKAVSKQNVCVSYLSEISSDENGMLVIQDLINNFIMFDPLMCNSTFSTMTAKAVEKNGVISYEFSREGSTAVNISKEKIVAYFDTNSTVDCIMTGSIAFADCNSREQILSAIDKRPEAFIFFDPNVRPSLIKDREEYLKAVKEFASKCDIFKLSDEDLAYLGISEEEALNWAKTDLIVTYGKNGSRWFKKGKKTVEHDAFELGDCKDTVGCGDTFSGNILAWLDFNNKYFCYSDDDRLTMLRRASAAAALNCLERGCNPPSKEEVDKVVFEFA